MDTAVLNGATAITVDCTPSTGNTPLFPVGVLLRRVANITPACTEQDKRTRAQNLLTRLLPDEVVSVALAYLAPLFGWESVAVPTKLKFR